MGYMVLHIDDDPTVDGTCGNDSATLGIKYNARQWFNLTLTKVIHLDQGSTPCSSHRNVLFERSELLL